MEVSLGSYKVRVEIVLLIIVVSWILFGHLLCGCCRVSMSTFMKEGFSIKPELAKSNDPGYILNPSTWSMPTLTYSPGTTPDTGVQSLLNRPYQPVPPPEGQLDMLATTQFKPECCPNTYSSSEGCACMTQDQYMYLKTRGSNNVPISDY
jgi:hypothetical protein